MDFLISVVDYYKQAFLGNGVWGALAQGVGFLALVVSFFIYQQKTMRRTLLFKMTDDALWTIHFFMLGPASYVAGCLNFICMLRELVLLARARYRWAAHFIWIPVFIAINWIFSGITVLSGIGWDITQLSLAHAYNLFSIIGSTIAVIGLCVKSPRTMRMLMLPAQSLWMIYAAIVASIPSMLSNGLMAFSILISIVRYDLLQSKKTPGEIAHSQSHRVE